MDQTGKIFCLWLALGWPLAGLWLWPRPWMALCSPARKMFIIIGRKSYKSSTGLGIVGWHIYRNLHTFWLATFWSQSQVGLVDAYFFKSQVATEGLDIHNWRIKGLTPLFDAVFFVTKIDSWASRIGAHTRPDRPRARKIWNTKRKTRGCVQMVCASFLL